MEDSANAAHAANEQKVYTEAVASLGNEDSASARLGGIYGLYDLAQSKPERHKSIAEILCAHLRETTQAEDYKRDHPREPSNEVASLLGVLCKLNNPDVTLNFQNVYLQGASFEGAQLQGARLRGAQLQGANLSKAYLQGANLTNTQLQEADLTSAHLQEADFINTQLQGANLGDAQLQGTDLYSAYLQGASLRGAQLQGAALWGAQLQGANLTNTQLQGASLEGAQLQGASLGDAQLQGAYLINTQLQGAIAEEGYGFGLLISRRTGKSTDLKTAIFSGGLTDAKIEEIRKGLAGVKGGTYANQLCARLTEDHMGPADYSPPDNITTGVLTEEMADEILRDYNAMKNSGANTNNA